MDLNEYLHKFVNDHSENFLQNFYSLVESSQIECRECPIEKTNIDNFLLKIYIKNMIHNIRTLILACVCGSVSNLIHNTDIKNAKNCVYLIDDNCNILNMEKDNEQSKDSGNMEDLNNSKVNNEKLENESNDNCDDDEDDEDEFLNKCLKIHKLRKSLKTAQVKPRKFYAA